jgi:hypothetical protein
MTPEPNAPALEFEGGCRLWFPTPDNGRDCNGGVKLSLPGLLGALASLCRLPGNEPIVGVAGRTLILLCGLRGILLVDPVFPTGLLEMSMLLLLLRELALLCPPAEVCRGILRILEMDELVDLRPRSPAELRRYDDLGVAGDGEREFRWVCTFPTPRAVSRRGAAKVVERV